MSHDHPVDAAGWRRGWCVQIGIAVEPQQVDVLVIAAGAGQQADRLRAIATQHQDQSAAFNGHLGVNFQIVEAGDDRREIAGAAMFFIVGEKAASCQTKSVARAEIREPNASVEATSRKNGGHVL